MTTGSQGPILSFRRLHPRDRGDIDRWFKHPEVRQRMEGMLPLDRWMDWVMSTPGNEAWMATVPSPVALVVLEIVSPTEASVALLVDPELWGHGYGRRVLEGIADRMSRRGFLLLRAPVHEGHAASLGCFRAAGFVPEADGAIDGFLTLHRKL